MGTDKRGGTEIGGGTGIGGRGQIYEGGTDIQGGMTSKVRTISKMEDHRHTRRYFYPMPEFLFLLNPDPLNRMEEGG